MTRHPMALPGATVPEHEMDAPGWRCVACGATMAANAGLWRWNGGTRAWEHHHPDGWKRAEREVAG